MNNTKLIALCLVCLGLMISCKKNDKVTSGGSSSTTSTSTSNGDPSGTYSGFLINMKAPASSGSVTYTISSGTADFYSTPQTITVNSNGNGTTPAGNVFLNNVKLKWDPTVLSYSDTTYTVISPPATWNITGAGSIPSFTYTNNTAMPVYGGTGVPSVVTRSQNLTIPITGASGYDQVMISIEDGSAGQHVYGSSSATSLTFSKDSLAHLTAQAGTAQIFVALVKYNPQLIAGKNFLFATVYYYTKQNVTIN